jgi:uncharacterized repeat protein (TIGR01451 family)
MSFKFYPLKALLFALLLFGFKSHTQAQALLQFTKSAYNYSTNSNGSTALMGHILIYTITVQNLTSQNFVAAKLYDNIPAGTAYIVGSTTLNGAPVTDKAGGLMPYTGNGGAVNSPTYASGILAPSSTATIIFRVKVTANGGKIFNNATIDATQNAVSTIQATNTVTTTVAPDGPCSVVYQVTPQTDDNTNTHSYFRTLNTTNGLGGPILAQGPGGAGGTPQRDAYTGAKITHAGDPGSFPKVDLLSGSAAIAYDRDSNRIYFVNNTNNAPPLCYYDLDTDSLYRMTGYPLETMTCGTCNVNRMGMGSDGYFYALTSGAEDLIRFKINPGNIPVIQNLGALTNAATNNGHDVRTEGGGDLFADGSGKLYLIVNSSNMYKINPNTRVATFMGAINFTGGGSFTSQSLAIDAYGVVYIGGAYNKAFTLNLQTMTTTRLDDPTNTPPNGVYYNGDFTSCGFPVLASSIIADKTYKDLDGDGIINGGDTVEYKITVTNIGNLNAAGVYMYDYIPPSTVYIPNTTKLNGASVADVGGIMPYAKTGSPNGKLVNTAGQEPGILLPTPANAAVVTFRVKTEPNKQVCNQSRITLLDADGNVMFVNSSDPTNVGQTPTCFYSDGVLPLMNLKFKGSLQEQKSVLNWTMNGDEGVATYDVEYSESGTSFTKAGTVVAKENANIANSYQFTDVDHTFSTTRYYRLKVNQKGGNINYSGVIRLNINDLDVEAVPNPFEKDINVQIRLKTAEQVRIRLIDFAGREVYSTSEQLGIGSHSLSVRIPSGLSKGMYMLDVRAGKDLIFTKKLLKK